MKCLWMFFFVVLVSASSAMGAYNWGDFFVPTGPAELLTSAADHSTEATTENLYAEYVYVRITGAGTFEGLRHPMFDAFYGGGFNDEYWYPEVNYHSLFHIAFDGNVASYFVGQSYWLGGDSPLLNEDDPNVPLFETAFNPEMGVFPTKPGMWLRPGTNFERYPAYNAEHSYEIVLLINGPPRIVNFGVAQSVVCCINATGNYDIVIMPVAPIPAPLSILCLAPMALLGRRKN